MVCIEFDYRRRGIKLDDDWWMSEDDKIEKVESLRKMFPEWKKG